jgi:hypothetical protein
MVTSGEDTQQFSELLIIQPLVMREWVPTISRWQETSLSTLLNCCLIHIIFSFFVSITTTATVAPFPHHRLENYVK